MDSSQTPAVTGRVYSARELDKVQDNTSCPRRNVSQTSYFLGVLGELVLLLFPNVRIVVPIGIPSSKDICHHNFYSLSASRSYRRSL